MDNCRIGAWEKRMSLRGRKSADSILRMVFSTNWSNSEL